MKIKTKDLEELGWEFDYFYGPGMENMYKKNGKNIRVANYENKDEAEYIMTYSGHPTRHIESIQDLKNYELTGI